jgi:hypothetical protein
MFDADQYLEAVRLPELKYGGKVYRGELLSEDQWMRFAPRFQQAARGELSWVEYRVLVWQLGRAFFPKPFWKVWERSVGRILLRLPPKVREAALKDFLAAQGDAMGLRGSQTPGSSSPPEEGEPETKS